MCGGDPLKKQKMAAAAAQQQLAQQQAQLASQNAAVTEPFYQNRLQNGLPYLSDITDYNNGTIARAFAPAKGQLARQRAIYGNALPNGYADQEAIDLNSNEGRTFDDSIVNALNQNEATKQVAASALNPLPFFSGSMEGNNSVLGARIQPSQLWSLLGGLGGAGLGALGQIGAAGKL